MRRSLVFFGITVIIGFMLAIQFYTIHEPKARDTRDIWELRKDLEKVKKVQQELNSEIYKYERLVDEYTGTDKQGQIETLEKTLKELKKEAGITEVSGQGIILTIEPLLNDEALIGQPAIKIQPELIRRLINELNTYGAQEISIDGERIINTSPIREVNGKTYINDEPLSELPIEVKVISMDAKDLHAEMLTSQSGEDFAREGLRLESALKDIITLPAFEHQIRVKYMQQKEGA
ncbi:DUF881 domain-containing protein [Alkalihalobacillus sp. AL-G]|uniref:DUF881 domain-containing protein n=1 Tax=Alkalihalobacillus sp. AL-G TaxID=2926399 RepID=UPI00272C2E65|nr:DUF881 domain-containing protein [Alkalihalobacillus sp. AL-G]WLD95070.1 DUF881 domain-containing protein [Alkalihalobacillus sp. AL-G]